MYGGVAVSLFVILLDVVARWITKKENSFVISHERSEVNIFATSQAIACQ
jgi:hypothetical protein